METIEVRYAWIDSLPGQVFHKYIIYTNSEGEQFVAQAFPTNRPDTIETMIEAETGQGTPYGELKPDIRSYNEPQDSNSSEIIKTGDDLSSEWNKVKEAFEIIDFENQAYKPFSQNSNYAADEALKYAGLPLPERDGLMEGLLGKGYYSPGSDQLNGLLGDLADALAGLINFGEWKALIDDLTNNLFNSAAKFIQPVRRDPLTLDLDGDGLETVGTSAGILFDHNADGVKTGTGWVKADDGLLVLDRNGNGAIDNGRELFGDSTVKSNGQLAADGFDALADLDSNADGSISSADTQFASLRVWRDLNQDGVSQSGELFSLNQLGIASIQVTSTDHSKVLSNGNQVADLGSFTKTDGSSGTMGEVTGSLADINLATDTFHRQFTDHLDTSAVANLPDMQGSGAVCDLREAASVSGDLANDLAALGANTTRAELLAAIPTILQHWAVSADFTDSFEAASDAGKDLFFVPPGVSALDAYNARYAATNPYSSTSGVSVSTSPISASQLDKFATIRAQQDHIETMLKVLEAFNGRDFVPLPGDNGSSTLTSFSVGTPSSSNYTGFGGGKVPMLYNMEQGRYDLLLQSYNTLTHSVFQALSVQTHLKPLLDLVGLKVDADGINLDFSALNAELDARIEANALNGFADLVDLAAATKTTLQASGWDGWGKVFSYLDAHPMTVEMRGILNFAGATNTGSNLDDLIVGDNASNSIIGGNGNDKLFGGGGNDNLIGGAGNDTLYGDIGDDVFGRRYRQRHFGRWCGQ